MEHLGSQPDLKIVRLERNLIEDFYGAERCPKLKEVRIRVIKYHKMCIMTTLWGSFAKETYNVKEILLFYKMCMITMPMDTCTSERGVR